MKQKYLTPMMLILAIFLATPALSRPMGLGPKYDKYVASLEDMDGNRFGQVIFNTNPEDDGTCELEVEVEECLDLADSIVGVKLDGVSIGTMYIGADGNGKATFYVEAISTDDIVSFEGAATLTSGEWRLREKFQGQSENSLLISILPFSPRMLIS